MGYIARHALAHALVGQFPSHTVSTHIHHSYLHTYSSLFGSYKFKSQLESPGLRSPMYMLGWLVRMMVVCLKIISRLIELVIMYNCLWFDGIV